MTERLGMYVKWLGAMFTITHDYQKGNSFFDLPSYAAGTSRVVSSEHGRKDLPIIFDFPF